MRVYRESVTVTPDGKMPRRVHWRGMTFIVEQVIDYWVYEGKWWEMRDGERREYLMLLTDKGTIEIFRMNGAWWLARIYD